MFDPRVLVPPNAYVRIKRESIELPALAMVAPAPGLSNCYDIILNVPLGFPYLDLALICHELGHVRYGTLTVKEEANEYVRLWHPWSTLFRFVYDIIEDSRIEYQLISEFPALLGLLMYLRSVRSVKIKSAKAQLAELPAALEATYDFLISGKVAENQQEPLHYLAPRATLVARSHVPLDSLHLASEYLGFLFLLYKGAESRRPTATIQLNHSMLQLFQRRLGKSTNPEPAQDKDGPTITPWGAITELGPDSMDQISALILRTGDLSYDDMLNIIHKGTLTCHSFAGYVLANRAHDVSLVKRAFARLQTPAMTSHYEGDLDLRKQSEAYSHSFSLEPAQVYKRKQIIRPEFDILLMIDTSGSMETYGLSQRAASDLVVVAKALQDLAPSVRVAIVAVSNDLEIWANFDTSIELTTIQPQAKGGTNFHLAFRRLPECFQWKHERRYIVILSDAIWPYQDIDWRQLQENPFYRSVKWIPVLFGSIPEGSRYVATQTFGRIYRDLLGALEGISGCPIYSLR